MAFGGLLLAWVYLVAAPAALAAGPPLVSANWVTEVTPTSAKPEARIDPNGFNTSYRFEYLSEARYQANLSANPSRDPFDGAAKVPSGGARMVAVGAAVTVNGGTVSGLSPATAYRYRVTASNSAGGPIVGPARLFTTQEPTSVPLSVDGRGLEMVSPLDKGGGAVQGPEQNFGGGVFQAAADGGSITYSSADSFGAAPQGAPGASQYLAIRGSEGWGSVDLTTPALSGSYGDEPDGVPYQLFSADLARGLLSNGERCRGPAGGECPVANPPLTGSDAPAGYKDYYLRRGLGSFQSLLRPADVAESGLGPDQFELDFAAASPDLEHVVLSSCAALTVDASEVSAPGGCDPSAQNLYEWSGSGLRLVNVLPGDTHGTPGAAVAAQGFAVSADGSRVYWREGGDLYLREGTQTLQVDESLGGGGEFQTASSDGRFAFFTKGDHLYRYDAIGHGITDLAPGGQVQGVLGASADGSHVYYLTANGLFLWAATGVTTEVAVTAAPSNYPPTTGTARVTPDGEHLLFLSSAELTGYESVGASEAFLYGPPPGGGAPGLICVSCNPYGERPEGPSSIPGAVANGIGPNATHVYKPRALSDDGHRVFFDSRDDLVVPDSGEETDIYEWEAFGAGDCRREGGCVALISGGRGEQPSRFVDASADGSDVFFLTDDSLVKNDPGSFDIYDAREGGGFPLPDPVPPCRGDACQILPAPPDDPTAGTLVRSTGNPPSRFSRSGKKRKHGRKHHRRKKHRSHSHRGGRR